MKKIVLDVETTGLKYNFDRIIEISCLEIKNRILTGKSFHTYLNPEKKISLDSYKIHGIKDSFLKDKPNFYDIAYNFLNFIYKKKLIIHNSIFDLNFINYEMKILGLPGFKNFYSKVIDTLLISRSLFPKKKNTLDALAKRYNLSYDRSLHSAYIDTKILLKIYLNLTKKFNKISFKSPFKKMKLIKNKINILNSNKDIFFKKYFKKINNF